MSVLAFVSEVKQVDDILTWAARFADSLETDLQILCWQCSAAPQYPLLAEPERAEPVERLIGHVREWIETARQKGSKELRRIVDNIQIQASLEPEMAATVVQHIRRHEVELLVAMNQDTDAPITRTDQNNPLLRQSPCDTVILMRGGTTTEPLARILVGTGGSSSDATAAMLAERLSSRQQLQVTIARVEDDPGQNAIEVGKRELGHLMKGAGIRKTGLIRLKVYRSDEASLIVEAANQADLVLVGANSCWNLKQLEMGTDRPAIAVVKRAAPLKKPGTRWVARLLSPLSPAAYGDLISGLRRGSRISEEFVVMLGLAAAIASLGLLQDSPAVVIGSMLLAPLMTPMIGCGLATAQANPTLGRSALLTIFVGFVLTLVISIVIGLVTPGTQLTTQIMLRGDPNILDLLVALFSGAAAAYALARPNIVAALAGVAIATALVPPLCSSGISLAYLQFENAIGAGILFITNLVAIILSAALTFRLLGITARRITDWQRNWVVRVVGILGVAAVALAIPLEKSLEKSLLQGRPSLRMFPLTKAVNDAIVEELEKIDGVHLLAGGRPVSEYDTADVVLVLSAREQVDQSLGDRLIEITRQRMEDESLIVEVHCLQDQWYRSNQASLPETQGP